ncbi:unnamed protein product [Clavelina lepadiformis]|uniref:DUF3715 domain-containing protein n=1 Tax=Clavelina lepadiformis TaxID=159417 RepID=A0ABP0FR60_CLALP
MEVEKSNNNAQSSTAAQKKAIIAKVKASGFPGRKPKQKPDEESDETQLTMKDDEQDYNYEKLKSFHIPRKEQQDNKDLLIDLPLQSREFTHTLYPAIKSSFFYGQSAHKVLVDKVGMVNNPILQKEFLEKKKDLKEDGRSEKELLETYGFVQVCNKYEVDQLCTNGVEVGNCSLISLGKPAMGVYLSKHADVTTPIAFDNSDSGYIVVFKFIKGKTKVVTEFRGATPSQEPTPLYDCHITKLTGDPTKVSHIRAYQALQYYIYEYGELDVVKRPRQILPYAVLHYIFTDGDISLQQRENQRAIAEKPKDSDLSKKVPFVNAGPSGESMSSCLWEGKLLVKGGSFCSIELRTDTHGANNFAFLDRNLNVKVFLPLDKFSKQLPSTLLNKSGKKHNVIYRKFCYNIFTLMPTDESGVGKFRQLIAHLVQRDIVAFIPLRMSCCMYLLARSKLTVEKMGLLPPACTNRRRNSNFLYAIIVTPKSLTQKINEKKTFNMITLKKRKDCRDNSSDVNIPDELDQKLRVMNIDPNAVVGSMAPEQIQNLLTTLKDKKRIQTSDKFLHSHYKDIEALFSSAHSEQKFLEKVDRLWKITSQTRADYNQTKKKPVISKPEKPDKVKSSLLSKTRSTQNVNSMMDLDDEASFSAEEGSDDEPIQIPTDEPNPIASDPRLRIQQVKKRKLSSETVAAKETAPITKMKRPSFKPLDEVLTVDNNVQALMIHPDFTFSSRYEKTHRLTKGPGYSDEMDVEPKEQIFVTFRQQVPFDPKKDCPYACDGDPLIKSMLRAIYEGWKGDESDESDDNGLSGREKVLWVRQVLHLKKKKKSDVSDPRTAVLTSPGDKKAGAESSLKDLSPSTQGGASTDSGFASSSTTTTPTTAAAQPQCSALSLHELANLLADALQEKDQDTGQTAVTKKPDIKSLLQDLTQKASEMGQKDANMQGVLSVLNNAQQIKKPQGPDHGHDVDTQLEASMDRSPGSLKPADASPSQDSPTQSLSPSELPSGHPQDPRLNRRGRSLPRLPLPRYRFPPSMRAEELLPKDAEAAQSHHQLYDVEKRPTPPAGHPRCSKNEKSKPTPVIQSRFQSDPAHPGNSSEIRESSDPRLTTAMSWNRRGILTHNPAGKATTSLGTNPTILPTHPSDPSIMSQVGEITAGGVNQTEVIEWLRKLGVTPPLVLGTREPPVSTGMSSGTKRPDTLLGRNPDMIFEKNGQMHHTPDDVLSDETVLDSVASTQHENTNNTTSLLLSSNFRSGFVTPAHSKLPNEKFYIKFSTSSYERVSSSAPIPHISPDNDEDATYVQESSTLLTESADSCAKSSPTNVTLEKSENNVSNSPINTQQDSSIPRSSSTENSFKENKIDLSENEKLDVPDPQERRTSSVEEELSISNMPVVIEDAVRPTGVITPTPRPLLEIPQPLITSDDVVMPTQSSTSQSGSSMLSEIDKVLMSVRNAQERNLSTEGAQSLSSRLFELALQLRQNEPTSPQSLLTCASSTSAIVTVTSRSVTTSQAANVDFNLSTSSSDLEGLPIPSVITPMSDHFPPPVVPDATHPDFASNLTASDFVPQSMASFHFTPPSAPYAAFSSFVDGGSSENLFTSAISHLNFVPMPVGALERDVHTPTQDDTYDSNMEQRVRDSELRPYEMLSEACRNNLPLDERVGNVLQSVNIDLTQSVHPSSIHSAVPHLNEDSSPQTSVASALSSSQLPSNSVQSRVAHVKPQQTASSSTSHSFYVFNPRGHVDCDEIESLLLMTKGVSFHMQRITNTITDASSDISDEQQIPITKDMIEESLKSSTLWVVIRSADVELLPALPYLCLLKCAGPRVQFVQADTAAKVSERLYTNILNGESGILLPVSIDILLKNHTVFAQLLTWMSRVIQTTGKPLWRLALFPLIRNQLDSRSKTSDDADKANAVGLLENFADHRDVVVDVPMACGDASELGASEVLDSAVKLQLDHLETTRHIVVLTNNDKSQDIWQKHRLAGIAVTNVHSFVRAIMDDRAKRGHGGGGTQGIRYSPLMKIYSVERLKAGQTGAGTF